MKTKNFETPKIVDDKLLIETPFGTLVAYASVDPEYPGIYIDLRREGMDCDMPVALVEYTETEVFCSNKPVLITRVWADAEDQDYTERVVHENIEKFFMYCGDEAVVYEGVNSLG